MAPRNLIGPTVRKLRSQKGWSQSQMAAKCQVLGWNISRDMLAGIEGQRRRITEAEIAVLAVVLKVSPVVLLPSARESIRALSKRAECRT